jgi:hypothetical protein
MKTLRTTIAVAAVALACAAGAAARPVDAGDDNAPVVPATAVAPDPAPAVAPEAVSGDDTAAADGEDADPDASAIPSNASDSGSDATVGSPARV